MLKNYDNDDVNKLDASTAEEIDALELNLNQDGDEMRDSDDGTGLIDDDLARDRIEGMTEVGPELVDKGVDSVAPGRDDTSATLRRRRPNPTAGAEDGLEGDLDEPRDEVIADRKVDE